MPFLVISHPVLNAKSVMYSIAFLLGTGNAPGNPRHVGHKLMFGSSVSTTPHLQNRAPYGDPAFLAFRVFIYIAYILLSVCIDPIACLCSIPSYRLWVNTFAACLISTRRNIGSYLA